VLVVIGTLGMLLALIAMPFLLFGWSMNGMPS
jgi:hypothetical protein